jgi:membrane associated rhomboid family serine protease
MSERDYFRHDWAGGRRPVFSEAPVTKVLAIAFAAVYLLQLLVRGASPEAWASLMRFFALDPYAVRERFKVWQLVTGALVHVGILHLLFNVLALWFFGKPVEERLGARRFLVFALLATLSVSVAYVLFSLFVPRVVPILGFSGASLAILTLLACWEPNRPVIFLFFPMRLWVMVALLVAVDLVLALEEAMGGGVAHAAHLCAPLLGLGYYRYGDRLASLGATFRRMADRRRRRARRRAAERDEAMRAEVDRILDKVARDGMAALTDAERRYLRDASERLRR